MAYEIHIKHIKDTSLRMDNDTFTFICDKYFQDELILFTGNVTVKFTELF